MITINVTDSLEAETVLNTESIVTAELLDSDFVEVYANDYFDAVDILSDNFLLQELVDFEKGK